MSITIIFYLMGISENPLLCRLCAINTFRYALLKIFVMQILNIFSMFFRIIVGYTEEIENDIDNKRASCRKCYCAQTIASVTISLKRYEVP